jgi:hypothetical protein
MSVEIVGIGESKIVQIIPCKNYIALDVWEDGGISKLKVFAWVVIDCKEWKEITGIGLDEYGNDFHLIDMYSEEFAGFFKWYDIVGINRAIKSKRRWYKHKED